jgi:hypothetical protein
MRKGFFASVAAVATGTGVALGQGYPTTPPGAPPGYPTWTGPAGPAVAAPGGPGAYPGPYPGGPGAYPGGYPSAPMAYPGGPAGYATGGAAYPGGPAGPTDFQGTPMGYPGGYPGGPGPMDVPPAGELPLNGQVAGPNSPHPLNPAAPPKHGMQIGQIHKAAGGPDRWYLDIEENLWAVRTMPVGFPLLTAGTVDGAGVLGTDNTHVVIGDKNIDYGNYFHVFRLTGGVWDCNRVCGFEMSGFVSEGKSQIFEAVVPATSQLVLARPFIDAITGQQSALLVAFPGQFAGQVHFDAHLNMEGAEANFLYNGLYCDRVKFNWLAGIRYVNLEERLEIETTTFIPSFDPNDPTSNTILDRFDTRNQFFGGQVGLQTELRRGRYFMDATGKIAVGNMNERLNIFGSTTSTVTGVTTTVPGGLLALVSNIGSMTKNEFAYVPELTLKFGYQWTQRISTYIGYNMLYMSRVVRPGDQIDPFVNPVFVPVSNQFGSNFGPVRPIAVLNQSDFWAQGVTFGLSIRY